MLPKCYICGQYSKGFRFPVKESRRKIWLENLECEDPKKYGSFGPTVCSDHFKMDTIKVTNKGARLTEDAIPLPVQSKAI